MWNNRLNTISFYTSFIAFGLMIVEAGFYTELLYRSQVIFFYDLSFLLTIFNILYYNMYKKNAATRKLWPLEILIILLVILYYAARLEYNFFDSRNLRLVNQRLLYLLITLCFIRDFSCLHINFKEHLSILRSCLFRVLLELFSWEPQCSSCRMQRQRE